MLDKLLAKWLLSKGTDKFDARLETYLRWHSFCYKILPFVVVMVGFVAWLHFTDS